LPLDNKKKKIKSSVTHTKDFILFFKNIYVPKLPDSEEFFFFPEITRFKTIGSKRSPKYIAGFLFKFSLRKTFLSGF
jgi:hypothetical protein